MTTVFLGMKSLTVENKKRLTAIGTLAKEFNSLKPMILAQNFVKMFETRQGSCTFMPCSASKLIRFKVQSSFNPYNFRLDKMTKTSQGFVPCEVFS